ncbi:MAG: polyprenyl synthetase family protein [Clostridiaceae bacterium]|jgi:geranylgeranyl diphosphate synthase type II|nr:polyprenyl synthetase family protein [Clostridiaceae bacterium]
MTNDLGQPFADRLRAYQNRIERALPDLAGDLEPLTGGQVVTAARYSLLAGGKRIRPVLLLAVADMLQPDQDEPLSGRLIRFACALEMIHTYSLIHDDLPCMDDDDLRRGRPTCHKVYGEAMAVLAGDHLLNRAYEVMLAAIEPGRPETLLAAQRVSAAAGRSGMIGGQVLDLQAEKTRLSPDALERLHEMKTGALLAVPVEAAAVLCQAGQAVTEHLAAFGRHLGLAFQIRDDMLDLTADTKTLGKTAGKDQRDMKSTYVTLYGLEEAGRRLRQATAAAETSLNALDKDLDTSFLRNLARFLLRRSQ